MDFLAGRISSKIRASVAAYESESAERSADSSLGQFSRPRYVAIVVLMVICSVAEVFQLVTPPDDIAKTFADHPKSFELVRSGKVFFSRSDDPTKAAKEPNFDIELPYREVQKLKGYLPDGIWYDFRVEVPQRFSDRSNLGILIPRIWGSSQVFVDGEFRDFGQNLRPIFPLRSNRADIRIHVKSLNGRFPTPITATYPLVIGGIDELRSIALKVDQQVETLNRASAIYGLAIMLFGMLFVAYPRKPELLAFIFFLLFTAGDALVQHSYDVNSYSLKEIFPYVPTILSFDFLSNLALLGFSLFFFRAHPRSVFRSIVWSSLSIATVGVAITYFLYKSFPDPHLRSISRLVLGFFFLGFQLYALVPRMLFFTFSNRIPRARKIAGFLIVATIVIYYAMNLADYFVDFFEVTTLPRNNLVLHLALAIVVAYEVARAEVRQLILGSLLPREVRDGINFQRDTIDQKGFVLLIDAVGYSANRERFNDFETRATYIGNLATNMLKPVSELGISNFSILNCTGDGIYCAIQGEANRVNLEKVIALAQKIVRSAEMNENRELESISFRAAFGYGHYGVRIIKVGSIRKDFVAGNVLNDLSRVIGSGRSSVRVLIGPETKTFFSGVVPKKIEDKHGFIHEFFELDEIKKAA